MPSLTGRSSWLLPYKWLLVPNAGSIAASCESAHPSNELFSCFSRRSCQTSENAAWQTVSYAPVSAGISSCPRRPAMSTPPRCSTSTSSSPRAPVPLRLSWRRPTARGRPFTPQPGSRHAKRASGGYRTPRAPASRPKARRARRLRRCPCRRRCTALRGRTGLRCGRGGEVS
jgi:hypothetical protein